MPKLELDVADIEHIGALISGGLLLATGLKRGGRFGAVLGLAGAALVYRGQSGYKRLYDALGLQFPDETSGPGHRGVHCESTVEVNRPKSELYRIWRNLENLPCFMRHLESVVEIDDTRSRWVARGPFGTVAKWEAKIVNDVEDELIAWVSMEGSGVDSAGSVHFEDAGHNRTRIRVRLSYDPPGDRLGVAISKLFGRNPEAELEHDLQEFKKILEISSPPNRPKASVS